MHALVEVHSCHVLWLFIREETDIDVLGILPRLFYDELAFATCHLTY